MKTTKTVFISYSHKDEELKKIVVSHLKVFDFKFNIWSDEEINIGNIWELEIKSAIDKSDIAILLISNDFLISDFIKNIELPYLVGRQEMYNLRIVPFILKPSNWKELTFYKDIEAMPKDKSLIEYTDDKGGVDVILTKFAKKINELISQKTLKEISKEPKEEENESLFKEAFIICRILHLFNEDKKYKFTFSNEFMIYDEKTNDLKEVWIFVDDLKSIKDYSNILLEISKKHSKHIEIGIVTNNNLNKDIASLSYFFEILRKLTKSPKERNSIVNILYSQSEVKLFIDLFYNQSMYSPLATQTIENMLIFERFHIVGYGNTGKMEYIQLISEIFDLITKKFKINLTNNNESIIGLEQFKNAFRNVLNYMKINQDISISVTNLLSKIDILKLPSKNKNNLDFIAKNYELVETNISNISDTTINNLYIELRANFYDTKDENNKQDIDNLSIWLQENINIKDFIIFLGDFGYGKTTFFKYMVAELSMKYTNNQYIPVYISFKEHFSLKNKSLKDAVQNSIMPCLHMTDEFWNTQKWIIFCDGFDELSVQYQDSENWITLIFSMLLNESKKPNIKIVLSSRPILFLDMHTRKNTISKFDRVVLKPFNESQIIKWLEKWSKDNNEITLDMFKNRDILEVAKTPVILFLIAIIFHEELNESGVTYSKSQIYKKFFDWTAKSGGYISNDESVKHIVPSNYRDILQEIARQIFIHPDAISGMLSYDILLEQIKEKFDGTSLTSSFNNKIFVAHAFKESKPEHIEFIHQSLREYLIAEKIFDVFYDLENQNESKYELKYNQILFTKAITKAKLDFFKEMTINIKNKDILKERSLYIFSWSTILYELTNKNPKYILEENFFRRAENKIIKTNMYVDNQMVLANLTLLGYVFYLHLQDTIDNTFSYEQLNQINSFFKSHPTLDSFTALLGGSFDSLKFINTHFENTDFTNFQLSNSLFCGVSFKKCIFDNTNFLNSTFNSDKNIQPTKISRFDDCMFNNMKLLNVTFSFIQFTNCNFTNYETIDIIIKEKIEYKNCNFTDSFFYYYEYYKDIIFTNCTFSNVKFNVTKKQKYYDSQFNNCIMRNDKNKWTKVDRNIWKNKKD